ncbi:hypothetical protein [Mycolicibacterium brisbanense]|uniref:Uncharacterized protein n=1 Tax=Mycolicibacterium brisbanense TaxID=146020 RepID=A0A117I622_9MYCO|nr:hypothetical protein [Mycolicibacterium brisbanense]MCV7161862.1 hypothetical protein [Mycolicibacterium brisbanense]GAS89375.1 uncharacterized protein RMCB_3471 [Mycolicibacterium brisbanense]
MSKIIPAPPPDLELSPVPNIRTAAAAAEWITGTLGIPVTERYVRVKTNEKLIRYSIIQGVRHYSSQALYEFIMSTQKEHRHGR